jgi:plasmid replication initiation protein
VEVTPSIKGLATIYDKDILIYCISQLIAKMNRGEQPSKTVYLQAYDLLVATNRQTGGEAYTRLVGALERLRGTSVTTNIETNKDVVTAGFGLVEKWDVVKKRKDGRMVSMSVTLSDWLYNAVIGKEVLTLNRDYFRLRKPIERRVYEVVRKHCGQQKEWRVGLDTLLNKCGSSSPLKRFRQMIRDLCKQDHLPDYQSELDGDTVIFRNREAWWESKHPKAGYPVLDTETFSDAKPFAVKLRQDVYALEQDWREWWDESGRPPLSDPDKAFIGFCRRRAEKASR